MNIAVIGIGGIGGYYGGKIAAAMGKDDGTDVYFIARGAHLDAVRKEGLTLITGDEVINVKPKEASADISNLPEIDYCLVCVKGYDLADVLAGLKPKLGPASVVLPILNGMDIYSRVKSIIPDAYVHPACAYISSGIESPGVVHQRGDTRRLILGPDPSSSAENKTVLELLDSAGIEYEWQGNPSAAIWTKFVFISAFGLVTADSGLSVGAVLDSPEQKRRAIAVMEEIAALAAASGVVLSPDIIGDTLATALKFPYETTTSMQRDFAATGKPDERGLFAGAVIKAGKRLGVPTPAAAAVLESLDRKKPLAV